MNIVEKTSSLRWLNGVLQQRCIVYDPSIKEPLDPYSAGGYSEQWIDVPVEYSSDKARVEALESQLAAYLNATADIPGDTLAERLRFLTLVYSLHKREEFPS